MKTSISKYSSKILMLALFSSFISCNDFLDNPNYGDTDSDAFWVSEKKVIYATNSLYVYAGREEVGGRGHMWFENCSDDMVTGRTNSTADRIKDFQMGTDVGYISEMYNEMYHTIAKANDILYNVPNMKEGILTKKFADFAMGQAYFFRGYSYLWLAPWFGDNGVNGGIPIVVEGMSSDEINALPRPASVLDNYDMIIDDMRKAADLLPSWTDLAPTNYGRPYKTAAWAFAARAALYAAQYDNKYYDVVIEMCDKIINLTGADKRALYPDFNKLFTIENNFSSEYIYSILGNATDGPKFHGMGFQKDGYGLYNTWGYFQPTAELYEAYSPSDIRRDATILVPGQHIMFIGKDIHFGMKDGKADASSISSTSGLTFRKFMSVFAPEDCLGKTVNPNGDNQTNALGQCVMRYADILLMKAEAMIQGGKGSNTSVPNCDSPKGLLGQIRERAGLSFENDGSMAELKKQRRLELAYEFLPSRHLDLVRWGDAQEVYSKPLHGYEPRVIAKEVDKLNDKGEPVLDANGNVVKETVYTFDPSGKIQIWPARSYNPNVHHVFPIPQEVIDKSENVKQNIGY